MGVLGILGTVCAEDGAATVKEREDQDYSLKIDPDEKATFRWEVLNPTNATYNVSVATITDNPDFKPAVDRDEFKIYSGQSDVIVLQVKSGADETVKAKITIVVTLENQRTGETVTAYKSCTVKVTVTHGVDFHGYTTLHPEWIGLEDNDFTRVLMIILFYVMIAVITILIFYPTVKLIVRKTKTEIDDIILSITSKPLFVLIVLYGCLDAVSIMDFIPDDLSETLTMIFGLAVLLVIIFLAYKLFKGVLIQFGKEFAAKTETEVDDVLIPVVEKIGVVVIFLFGLMGVANYFGVDLTVAAAGFGIVGLVIAFAAQNSIANFFGGIFVLLDRPFKVGEMILIDDQYCRVEHIGLRSTRVYNIFKNTIIVMPNDKLANSTVINLSAPDQAYKVLFYFGVEYGTDPDEFVDMIFDVARNAPEEVGIITDDEDRAMWCRLNDLKDSSMEFILGFWVKDIMDQWSAAGYIRTKLYYLCKQKGIGIPFPQMDVHIKDDKAEKDGEVVQKTEPVLRESEADSGAGAGAGYGGE